MMKKLLALILTTLALMALPMTAGAERSYWKDKDYNFKQVRHAVINTIRFEDPNLARYSSADNAVALLEENLREALVKRNIKTYTSISKAPAGALIIDTVVNGLGTYVEHRKAYYREKTEYKKEVARDEHGKDVIVEVPVTTQEYHPAEDVTNAVVNLTFNVSTSSGYRVYELTDSRERDREDDVSGMLGRICKEMAKEISRN